MRFFFSLFLLIHRTTTWNTTWLSDVARTLARYFLWFFFSLYIFTYTVRINIASFYIFFFFLSFISVRYFLCSLLLKHRFFPSRNQQSSISLRYYFIFFLSSSLHFSPWFYPVPINAEEVRFTILQQRGDFFRFLIHVSLSFFARFTFI